MLSEEFFHLKWINGFELSGVLKIVGTHFGYSVPLFFMISAFSLYLGYFKKLDSVQNIKKYLNRRFWRIAPLFYILIIVNIILRVIYYNGPPPYKTVLINMSLLFGLFPENHQTIVMAGWTIGILYLFYLTLPLTMAYTQNLLQSIGFFLVFLVVGTYTQNFLNSNSVPLNYGFENLLTHMPFFLAGIISFFSYLFLDKQTNVLSKKVVHYTIFAISIITAFLMTYNNIFSIYISSFDYVNLSLYIWAIIFGVWMVFLTLHPNKLIVNKVTIFLGMISYSIYLWHPLIVVGMKPIYLFIIGEFGFAQNVSFILSVIVTFLVLLPISYASYKLIEQPFANRHSRETFYKKIASLLKGIRNSKIIISLKEYLSLNNEKIAIYSMLVIYCFSFFIIFQRPLNALSWQWADDAMYFNNAFELSNTLGFSPWFGEFNQLVISKVPFFSIFLFIVNLIGTPLRLAEFLLFAPLPFLFERAFRPFGFKKWGILVIASIFLVCIPVAGIETRLLRSTLFGALVLYCLIFLCGFIIRMMKKGKGKLWPWMLATGVFFGLATTTREEATWLILPIVTGYIIATFFAINSKKKSSKIFLLSAVFLLLGYAIPVNLFSVLNYSSYGIFSTSLRQNSIYQKCYSALTSFEPVKRDKYVPINTETRHYVYQISPHFSKLEKYIEGTESDEFAKNEAHLSMNGWSKSNREFFVSNFEFVFAKAIFQAGYRTGPEFLDFCNNVTIEIKKNSKVQKNNELQLTLGLLPPIKKSDLTTILSKTFKSFWLLVNGQGPTRNLSYVNNPDPIGMGWHEFLKTGAYPKQISIDSVAMDRKNFIFNLIVKFFSYSYSLLLIIGTVLIVLALKMKVPQSKVLFSLLMTGWASVMAFCIVMGVLDTVGWPVLIYSNGYNTLGFYSFHFLILINVFIALYVISYRKSVKKILD